MNAAQITHIFWKEYRHQRSIWLGIILIIWVCQFMAWLLMPDNARDPLVALMSVGPTLSIFYALASVGVLFAGEREEQTYSWLRILPVSQVSLFGGKFLWFAVSWLLAVGVSLLTAYLPYWGTDLDSEKVVKGVVQFASIGGGLALWGIFFSLLCQRVYTTLALAPLALLLTAGLNSYFPGVAYVLYAAVFIGVVVQGRRWIVEEDLAMWTGFGWRSRALTLDDALATAAEASPAWRFFRRELWLEWRNARWVALGSFCILTVTMYFLSLSGAPDAISINWFLAFAFLPLVYGVSTFRAEQYQARYRFQSHIGASPAAVWTAKHLVWGGLLVLTMVASWLSVYMPWGERILDERGRIEFSRLFYRQLPIPESVWPGVFFDRFTESWSPALWLSLAMAVWMYAIGHACSLLIKRSVSAALVAVALGAVVCVPVAATMFLDVPRVIAMGFPAGSLLLFGLWRTKGWLSERNEPRDWLRVSGVLATLGLVCTTSWVMWRISELTLPPVVAGFVSFFPIAGLLQISVFGGGLLLLVLVIALVARRRKVTFRRFCLGWSAVHVLSGIAYLSAFDGEAEPPGAAEVAALTPSEEALKTGNLYIELDLLIPEIPVSTSRDDYNHDVLEELFSGEREFSDAQLAWLNENEESLNQLIQVTKRANCAPDNLFNDRTWSERRWLLVDVKRGFALLRAAALQKETGNELEEAWKYHTAILRLCGHLIQSEEPYGRSNHLTRLRVFLLTDLKRWINHPDQTPQLLAQAARDFYEIVKDFYTLEDSFHLQATHQKWAVAGNFMGGWSNGDVELADWPVILDRFLHRLPGERQRALFMLERAEERQTKVAAAIRDGDVNEYGPEIAAVYWYGYDRFGGVRLAWAGYQNGRDVEESHRFWRLAETTPIIQAANQSWIDGYGTGPMRSEQILIEELKWMRDRRLVLLHMAFRAAELESGERVNSLERLTDFLMSPGAGGVLSYASGLEGKLDEKRIDYDREARQFPFWLYYDPISDDPFNMETVNQFRDPPVR